MPALEDQRVARFRSSNVRAGITQRPRVYNVQNRLDSLPWSGNARPSARKPESTRKLGRTLNWKLIFQLSLFALFMGVATVYFIPLNIEPICWLAIFVFSAYMIARECASGRFLNGLALGLVNCLWINAAHLLLFGQYLAHHTQETAMLAQGIPHHPRMTMALGGTVIGLASGVAIGLLALLAGKLMKTTNGSTKAMGQSA